ncbi:hypothetical protein J6590_093328 [Homalodisca vitripennis]|nr:hypothetical protein J6590_093328 [Homalodisca vitripennis]
MLGMNRYVLNQGDNISGNESTWRNLCNYTSPFHELINVVNNGKWERGETPRYQSRPSPATFVTRDESKRFLI